MFLQFQGFTKMPAHTSNRLEKSKQQIGWVWVMPLWQSSHCMSWASLPFDLDLGFGSRFNQLGQGFFGAKSEISPSIQETGWGRRVFGFVLQFVGVTTGIHYSDVGGRWLGEGRNILKDIFLLAQQWHR